MNTTFVNLTGHEIMLLDDDGNEILYLSYDFYTQAEAQLDYIPQGTKTTRTRHYNDNYVEVDVQVPIVHAVYSRIKGLPDPQPNTLYIVPRHIAQAVNRHDVLYVTGETVRHFNRF